MATGEPGVLVGRLFAAVAEQEGDRFSDQELVARFVERRDEAAFATLVQRHGSLVLGVARRLLHDGSLAEDVFQATFLLLARKAGTVRRKDSVGSWLHSVAVRLARRAQTNAARRQAREEEAGRGGRVPPPADPSAELSLREARQLLDEELSRLPEKYRAPLVLCCLEGLARDEAARRLGWPVGLVKSRLEQAREQLHRRLVRRGLTLSAAMAAVLLVEGNATASTSLVRSAIRAALGSPAAAGRASPGALALADGWAGSLAAKGWTKAVLVAIVSVSVGVGLAALVRPTSAGEQPTANPAESGKPAAGPDAKVPVRVDRLGDALPAGALRRFGTDRYRAVSPNDAALSADGKTLATASQEEVSLWDVATGLLLHRFRGAIIPPDYSPTQTFLAFSPDGTRLVGVGGWNPGGPAPGVVAFFGNKAVYAVHVWDTASGKEVGRLDLLGGTRADPTLAARRVWFTPDGKELGIVLQSGVVRFVDSATGAERRRFGMGQALRNECPCAVPSPDGKLLTVLEPAEDTALSLLDAATGKAVRRIKTAEKIEAVAFSPDSAVVAAATPKSILLFDAATGEQRKALSTLDFRVAGLDIGLTALTFAPDGKTLYAGNQAGQILRWRLPGGESLPDLTEKAGPVGANFERWVTGIFFPPDGRLLIAVGWSDGLIRRWDLATGKELPLPEGFRGSVLARLAPDGRTVAVGDADGKVQLFEAATGRPVRTLSPAGPAVANVRWSPDGKSLAVGLGSQGAVVWDPATGQRVRTLPATPAVANAPGLADNGLAYSPDGRYLLVASASGGTRMVDVGTGAEVWSDGSRGPVSFAPDGASFASFGSMGGKLLLRDAKSGTETTSQPLSSVFGPRATVNDLAFSPDGKWLAASNWAGAIHLCDPKTGGERRRIDGPRGVRCMTLAFSPDGKWVLSGWNDNDVRLFETATGKELFRKAGHRGYVGSVAFGPDGRTALSGSMDGTALLWDLRPARSAGRRAGAAGAWDDLAADDASKVYGAIWELADDPKSAVALLRKKLPVVRSTVDEKLVKRLIADLDAEAFETREKASKELGALGPPAVPLLRKALELEKSVEVQRRLQSLFVEEPEIPRPEDLRRTRAIQALELANTPETRDLLRTLAGGLAHAPLTEEARSALAGLEQRERHRATDKRP
jgi:RNA polymerase sigma factor (sigma-70 family)